MQITVKYRADLAALTKISGESMEADNIKDVLKHLKNRFGAQAEKLAKTMLIVVNGRSILLLKAFKTALKDGDEVSFLPICGGG
ncbi:MAG: MoaD/ThiS family protein [Treponema sp.]|jgi:MoaD family protein|nr:MoaD/ThiS family protein [Treponema sp.]